MTIQFAHIQVHGIDVAVFDAKPQCDTEANRDGVLADLTNRARAAGRKIDKSALAYQSGSRIMFYGTPDLVRWLRSHGCPCWTHTLWA